MDIHLGINDGGSPQKRRRAAKACTECRKRKVKCDVTMKGQPCANCAADKTHCEIVSRKKRPGRARIRTDSSSHQQRHSAQTQSIPSAIVTSPTDPTLIRQENQDNQDEDEEPRNAGALAAAIEDDSNNTAGKRTALDQGQTSIHFAGNDMGIVSFVQNLVNDGDPNRTASTHYLIPRTACKALEPEELQYLRYKGVFSIPTKDACDDLIKVYFLHVHPILPILDATAFLMDYIEHGFSKINLQLFWSMIFMAAGFAESDTLKKIAGRPSRKALKRDAYHRAKVLYETEHGNDDQIALIQSVILMGHWYADGEDRFEAWHWNNVAIGLCQAAGFHRAPTRKKSAAFTEARERLCSRIWWTCVVRDRWVSMVKGRPLRIRLEECNLAEASPEDIEYDLQRLSHEVKMKYFPFNVRKIGRLWSMTVKMSILLGDIQLHNSTKERGEEPSAEHYRRLKTLETASELTISEDEQMHVLERLCIYHVQLLFNALIIAFWRPLLFASKNATSDFRQQQAIDACRTAAIATNSILEEIITWDLVQFLKAQTINALVPPMQLHLLDCKSSKNCIRMRGTQRLLLCIQILTELKETYWAAEFALRLFQRAHEKVIQRRKQKAEAEIASSIDTEHTAPPVELVMPTPPPYHDQMPFPNPSSDDEFLLTGLEWDNYGGYPEMQNFWDNFPTEPSDNVLNGFFTSDDFAIRPVPNSAQSMPGHR